VTLRTALTDRLGIEHPVLLAPMDLVSDGRLAAAVSAAGGLGILGAGYGEATWLARELEVLAQSGRRWGVGFITWSLATQPHLLDLVLERRPVAVMLSFGDPAPWVDRIHAAGALALCQVQSIASARQAVAAGADILVAQGTEGGGPGASRGLVTLLPEIVDAVADGRPVVAAGGIADGRGLAAALMLGAAGALLGTRFYATEEAAGSRAAKQRICEAGGDDTARSIVFDISRRRVWPPPYTGRCIRNDHAQRWIGREVELLQRAEEIAPAYARAREAEDFDVAAVIAGEASGLVNEVVPVAAVMQRLTGQAEALLRDGARWTSQDTHAAR
jgi:nitronate monooxygenase